MFLLEFEAKSLRDAFSRVDRGVGRHLAIQKHFHGELLIKGKNRRKSDTNEACWMDVLSLESSLRNSTEDRRGGCAVSKGDF